MSIWSMEITCISTGVIPTHSRREISVTRAVVDLLLS